MASDRDNIVADAVVLDDLRGVDSHRINRLPSYIARIKAGVLATNPVLASLDVNNTFGFVVGSLVINERIEIASTGFYSRLEFKHCRPPEIRRAARSGESIPEGYDLDKDGRPTTDAQAALGGVVLRNVGAKGSGLAIMMDILGEISTGAAFGGAVVDMNKDMNTPLDLGHWILVC
ncbi:Malate/L-lactate dehydrogenase [Penicillium occitanis (nom. inval.)]|nr:hypothetical protein PENOC_049600 [Penicillium occitanis (nom. inval.)]PCH02565.1 Malate/L-lactate dehydrogenase [Penicillium occitanis (nom. inval.)]